MYKLSGFSRGLTSSLLAVVFLSIAGQAWAEAGRVLYVSGQATLIRGDEVPVTKGLAVESGDTLVTGDNGRIQLLMADGDRIALRPDTRFTIDEFSGPARQQPDQPVAARPSAWKSFYSLAKGGIRTLTQSLGQRDSSSYQVRTPVATIGIRGTDYTLLYCPEGCAAYKAKAISRNDINVDGLRASAFRNSAGSRLLFAGIGLSWVQQFLRADQQGSGGSSGGEGELLGGVSDGEIEITGNDGSTNTVNRGGFFRSDNRGFQRLSQAPQGLGDQSEGEGDGEFGEEGEGGEGEEGGGSGEGGGEGDGSVGDVTVEFGTADTGSTNPSDPPAQNVSGTGPDGSNTNLTGGGTTPQQPPPGFRGLADASGTKTETSGDDPAVTVPGGAFVQYVPLTVGTDGSGRAVSFRTGGMVQTETGPRTVVIRSALIPGEGSSLNDGFDIDDGDPGVNAFTGLRWGRWIGKYENTTTENGVVVDSTVVDLGDSSIHFIYGPDTGTGQPPVTQIQGFFKYQLIGNTNPTDNNGNVGFLGSAYFDADLTNQIVYTGVDIGINGQTWSGEGQASISSGTFANTFDSMAVHDEGSCIEGCSGQGEFAGFFTPGGGGSTPPPGAGMGYHMEQGGNEVSGAAAFGNPSESTPPQ